MLKFGVELTQEGFDFEKISNICKKSESLGFDSFLVNDHLFFSDELYLESWTLLTALAMQTSKIKIGPLVLCNSFRHPSLVAKMAATLDVISNGRLEFGIGAGWNRKEYLAYGLNFPDAKTRIKQLEESVQIIKKMWVEEKANFKGDYYTIKSAMCNPKPSQKPHPPIYVGGSGNLTLKVVAKHADGCNFQLSPEGISKKLEVLKKNCRNVGRDYNDIQKSLSTLIVIGETKKDVDESKKHMKAHGKTWMKYLLSSPDHIRMAMKDPKRALSYVGGVVLSISDPSSIILGTPEECISKIEEYAKLGVDYFILHFPGRSFDEEITLFADEVIKSFS